MLRLRNTLTGQVEEFHPINDREVRMYVCGPTVYDIAHIGNFRTFLFADLLRRYLKYRGYNLRHVMNITDVDDKIIARAGEEKKELKEYTDGYIQYFFEDFDALGAERPEEVLRATDHIPSMLSLIKRLEAASHTYRADGSVYYRIATFPGYGKLSKINLDGNIAGASERLDQDEYAKEDARDFALWKAARGGEPSWPSEFGNGRPGWHIECSAMSMHALGETFDLHVGGVDLIFPHHENEIAQSEGATGKPFVKCWVHSEFLTVEGEKMAKSKGNFYTFRDLVDQGHDPRAIRYLLLSVPHARQLNFTKDGLKGAETVVTRLEDFRLRLNEAHLDEGSTEAAQEMVSKQRQLFEEAMDDDLNTAEALAAVHDLVRETNTALAGGTLKRDDITAVSGFIDRFDSVFNVIGLKRQEMLDSEIQALIDERQAARGVRNFKRADEIREELAARQIILEDTKDGVRWRRSK